MRIEEIVEEGSVPNLLVINPASVAVLLIDGEELRGAKQNRIVNTTILIPPESRTKIDVSCTEQGRWRYNSPNFSHSKTIMAAKLRRRKSRAVSRNLEANKSYASNQGEVWREVHELNEKMGSHSHTAAMAAAFEAAKEELGQAVSTCGWNNNQYGLLAFINGKPAGLDLLSRQTVYREVHAQILQSYAMEALANERERIRSRAPIATEEHTHFEATREKAESFLKICADTPGKPYPSVGMGEDWRFQKDQIVGSGLLVADTWVHLAYFQEDQEGPRSSIRQRRIFRTFHPREHRRESEGEG